MPLVAPEDSHCTVKRPLRDQQRWTIYVYRLVYIININNGWQYFWCTGNYRYWLITDTWYFGFLKILPVYRDSVINQKYTISAITESCYFCSKMYGQTIIFDSRFRYLYFCMISPSNVWLLFGGQYLPVHCYIGMLLISHYNGIMLHFWRYIYFYRSLLYYLHVFF